MAFTCGPVSSWTRVLFIFITSLVVFDMIITMAYRWATLPSLASLLLLLGPRSVSAKANGSLADIKHVVLFMQENRAFDHYFGTLAGVRGFNDPNVQMNGNRSIWYQEVNSTFSNDTDYLLPWYLNAAGGDWLEATQCMVAGNNGWEENHAALNGDLNNHWVLGNTPWSLGYYKRSDLPVHYAIADGWTIGDMYQESVIASTNPNRVTWVSGSINTPGSPQSADEGGMTIDNYETPGCEGENLNCYPLKWKTAAEFYEGSGVTWQVYQDSDNFDDNPFAWFEQFQDAENGTALSDRGMAYLGLEQFYADAAAGTLPMISYIVGPTELSEHPPFSPHDGAWLQQQVINAVTSSPKYNETALLVSYDETGGWADHVTPYHSPEGTAGEWVEDPYDMFGNVYTGPGFRVPFYIVSPWTRGGNVFAERADHVSQIKFIERWLTELGYENITTDQIPAWRREHVSDLVAAFDFANPDLTVPDIPTADLPHTDAEGVYDGAPYCESLYAVQQPPVPYGNQTAENSLVTEQGYRPVRGNITEGRFLVLETDGQAVSNLNGSLGLASASLAHDAMSERWMVHVGTPQFPEHLHSPPGNIFSRKYNGIPKGLAQLQITQHKWLTTQGLQYVGTPANANNEFMISSAVDGAFIGAEGALTMSIDAAASVSIEYIGNGAGYELVMPGLGQMTGVNIYSVTYAN